MDSSVSAIFPVARPRVKIGGVCAPGYEGTGDNHFTCGPDGHWTGGTLQCTKTTRCSGPPTAHAAACNSTAKLNDVCRAECDAGYVASGGDNRFRCDETGRWAPAAAGTEAFACAKKVECDEAPVPHAHVCQGHGDGQTCEARERARAVVSAQTTRGRRHWQGGDITCTLARLPCGATGAACQRPPHGSKGQVQRDLRRGHINRARRSFVCRRMATGRATGGRALRCKAQRTVRAPPRMSPALRGSSATAGASRAAQLASSRLAAPSPIDAARRGSGRGAA